MDKNLNKCDRVNIRSNKQKYVIFKLLYLHRISTQIENTIRDFLKHCEINRTDGRVLDALGF